jgi:pimeloyl-ACP methyl ester carboxylesterase
LHRLLEVMQLEGPHNLLGLSYGGGIAMAYAEEFPEDVNKLILVAPYTEPLKAQDQWIRQQVSLTRITQPWNPSTDDELYDYFLKQNVYWTYPAAEPIVLENPYKLEATFRLVQGIRKWNASESFGSLPTAAVHMMVAQNDQYIPDLVLAEFWKSMPADAYGSYAVVTKSEHKIPEAQPKFAAAWVREILLENEVIADGTVFVADPISGIVRFHGGQLKLKF